jgi:hypothetical protein
VEGLKQRDNVTFELNASCWILCQAEKFSTRARHNTFPSSHRLSVPTDIERSAPKPIGHAAMNTGLVHRLALPLARRLFSQHSPMGGEWSSPGEPIHPGQFQAWSKLASGSTNAAALQHVPARSQWPPRSPSVGFAPV